MWTKGEGIALRIMVGSKGKCHLAIDQGTSWHRCWTYQALADVISSWDWTTSWSDQHVPSTNQLTISLLQVLYHLQVVQLRCPSFCRITALNLVRSVWPELPPFGVPGWRAEPDISQPLRIAALWPSPTLCGQPGKALWSNFAAGETWWNFAAAETWAFSMKLYSQVVLKKKNWAWSKSWASWRWTGKRAEIIVPNTQEVGLIILETRRAFGTWSRRTLGGGDIQHKTKNLRINLIYRFDITKFM